jgi:hypothetical protein
LFFAFYFYFSDIKTAKNSRKTKKLDDDFIRKVSRGDCEKLELTDNFFEMRDALEDSFETILTTYLVEKQMFG